MLKRMTLSFRRWGKIESLILVAVTTLLCYQVGSKTFHHSSLTTDEGSYVFQANNFLDGLIAREAPPFGRTLQHQMIIQDADVGWLSRYPPFHSLWLVPGVAIGNPYLIVAFTAGLSLLFITFTVRSIGIRAGPVIVLLLCSPYFIFMHGTLLSHVSGLACISFMLWGYVRWLVKQRIYWLVVAGIGWGLLFMGRPYSAFLLAIPFGIHSLLVLNRNRDLPTLTATGVFVLSSLSGVIGLLVYNYLAVGDPFTMTYFYYDSTEGLGFGMRHTQGEPTYHTLGRGLIVLWENLKSFDLWLLGWRGSLIVVLILVMAGWRTYITPLLLGGSIVLPLGYVFFWYEGVQAAGPVYYFESLPFLMVGATMGIARMFSRLNSAERLRRVISVVIGAALVIGATNHTYKSIRSLKPEYEQRRKLRRVIENAPPQSIVTLPNWPRQLHFMLNAKGLESDPLVINPHPDEWLGLTRSFPDRTPYRLVRRPNAHLIKLKPSKRFVVDLPAASFKKGTGALSEVNHVEQVIAKARADSPGAIGYGELIWLYAGSFKITYKGVVNDSGEQNEAVVVDFVEYGSNKIIAKSEITKANSQFPAEFCIEVDKPVLIEPRIYFSGVVDVQFSGLRIDEAQSDCN
jgi:hypothetical protein